jgi:hypothetical protein
MSGEPKFGQFALAKFVGFCDSAQRVKILSGDFKGERLPVSTDLMVDRIWDQGEVVVRVNFDYRMQPGKQKVLNLVTTDVPNDFSEDYTYNTVVLARLHPGMVGETHTNGTLAKNFKLGYIPSSVHFKPIAKRDLKSGLDYLAGETGAYWVKGDQYVFMTHSEALDYVDGQPNTVEKAILSHFKYLQNCHNQPNQLPLKLLTLDSIVEPDEITEVLDDMGLNYIEAEPLK